MQPRVTVREFVLDAGDVLLASCFGARNVEEGRQLHARQMLGHGDSWDGSEWVQKSQLPDHQVTKIPYSKGPV